MSSWLTTMTGLESTTTLPTQCHPTNDFLRHFSTLFHTCIPTPLAFVSNTLGVLSIVAWLFAQLPQIYKNWRISSTSGLSIIFLVEWLLGDLGNLLGALFTHQATWQVAIGGYYIFVDLCLVSQWLWYERLRHGRMVRRMWFVEGADGHGKRHGGAHAVVIEGVSPGGGVGGEGGGAAANGGSRRGLGGEDGTAKSRTEPRSIVKPKSAVDEKFFATASNTPRGTTIYRIGGSSPMPSPSPRMVLLIACIVTMVRASLVSRSTDSAVSIQSHDSTSLEFAGTILSWLSTVFYLGSRLPQLFKNWQRKSTTGLSPVLFMAAFCGNLCYSSALATNPCAWSDFGPYGGNGWAGSSGSDRREWVLAALPFFLGAAGVLCLDAAVGVQFFIYGEGRERVIVLDGGQDVHGRRSRWRRVSGFMKGWVPKTSSSVEDARERQPLIRRVS